MKSIKKSLLLSLAILFFINVFSQNYSQNKPEKNHHVPVQDANLVPLNLTITTSDGEPILFAVVTLEGPATYIDTIAENDPFEIEYVLEGIYDLTIKPVKYYFYSIQDIVVDGTQILNVVLMEKGYPPRNLYFDPLTLIATWDPPQITALLEDFNSPLFPPEDWTMESEGAGWFKTDSLSFPNFQIPPHNSQFACVIDYQDTVNNNGCCDYLITPPLDLRESDGYSLKFDSYYNGANGQSAYIEYSLDTCATWEVLHTLLPFSQWQYVEVDLSSISGVPGPDAVWLTFHADDNGQQASGWAIDNVDVSVNNNSDWPPLGYNVFLDNGFVAHTYETTYQFQYLTYGVEYVVCVAALYTSGSYQICYSFVSEYLIPPRNLQGMSPTGTYYVYLIWETPLEPYDYVVISEKPSTYQPDKNLEYSPIARMIEGKEHGRDQWDVQFNFPVGGVGSEVGLESNGNYIYTSQRDAGNGTFYKYGLDGTFLGSFVIPGCLNLCDLAYDGAHFFGSNATTSVWVMDFENQTVISTINAPTACRAIAYDDQADGFWCNNWTTDIVLFDKNGTQLNSFPVGAYANFHGFAYDGWSPNGPFLWGFSRDGSGAEIVQMDIATGAQIFNFNVLPLVGGSGVAGGLFSHCELIEPNLATLGGLLLSELIFGLELAECEGGGGIIPENLLGFNIYRNGEYQDYIESMPDSLFYDWYDFTIFYPGTYTYTVTAIYDLTPYGLPGDTAESMEEGPVYVFFPCYLILPFYEDWSSGNFEFNNWTTECDNWQINLQTGNPLPSAEFQGEPALADYECELISDFISAEFVIDGDIWLDFDIKLDSWIDTAVNEKLLVKVWENDTWHTVTEFINEGNMDWTSSHIDISLYAKGNCFRVGFFATGLNSADIVSWYIDNIYVYRVCLPPLDLAAEIEEYTTEAYVFLTWHTPDPCCSWLSYNDGTFENAMSSTNGGAGLAQVFTPAQYPCTIDKVRFYISEYMNYYQEEEVYVLTGDGATILAGPYVIHGIADDWVTVEVDNVTITEGTFMVATFNVLPDGPFIGIDDSYYDGSLYFGTVGNFTELGEYGYFYIGSHEVYVSYGIKDNIVVNSVLTSPQSNGARTDIAVSNTFSNGTKKPDRDLLGYNIFRSENGGEFININQELEHGNTYRDTLYTGGEYCYYTTAVYNQCESDSSNNACVSCYVGIEELISESSISIYPNPAKDFVNIISTENINKIIVINFAGQKVFEKKITEKTSIKLNTASYETGIYIIKIETEDGITAKRVTITR